MPWKKGRNPKTIKSEKRKESGKEEKILLLQFSFFFSSRFSLSLYVSLSLFPKVLKKKKMCLSTQRVPKRKKEEKERNPRKKNVHWTEKHVFDDGLIKGKPPSQRNRKKEREKVKRKKREIERKGIEERTFPFLWKKSSHHFLSYRYSLSVSFSSTLSSLSFSLIRSFFSLSLSLVTFPIL